VLLALGVPVGLHKPALRQGKKEKDKGAGKGATSAVFEVYKDDSKKFRFRLKGDDGVTLAMATKGYKTLDECRRVVEQIRTLAGRAKIENLPDKKK